MAVHNLFYKILFSVFVKKNTFGFHTMHMNATTYTPFNGCEAVIPIKFLVPFLCIALVNKWRKKDGIDAFLVQVEKLDEMQLGTNWKQQVQNERVKTIHDKHLKLKEKEGELILIWI